MNPNVKKDTQNASLIENTQDVPIKAHSVQLFQSNSTVITDETKVSDNWHSLTPQSTAMSWERWMRQDKIPVGSHGNLSLTLRSQSKEEFIGASAETYHSLTHHWGFVEFLHYLLYLSFVFPFNWKVLLFYLSSVSSVWVLYNSIQLFLVHTHVPLLVPVSWGQLFSLSLPWSLTSRLHKTQQIFTCFTTDSLNV